MHKCRTILFFSRAKKSSCSFTVIYCIFTWPRLKRHYDPLRAWCPWLGTDDWLFLKFMRRKWAPNILSNHHWASNCIWIISWQGFPLLSTSILWDDCHWESHCKVFIYNFIHHGARIMAYRALATPEPLCCGRPLVYSVLCKIRKELDPKRSPLRCNQPNSLQQRHDSTFHGNISQIP